MRKQLTIFNTANPCYRDFHCREIAAVCSFNRNKIINIFCGQNTGNFKVKVAHIFTAEL